MNRKIFITGISTEVGKTVASAVVCKALGAAYFKPVQAGELDYTDADKVVEWVADSEHQNFGIGIKLTEPMSPHAAALIDDVDLQVNSVSRPTYDGDLVIEGAGGLMVPLNEKELIADLIQKDDKVILVSKHYLGSINHTLLSVNYLKNKGLDAAILFVGEPNLETERIIEKIAGIPILGRLDWASKINADFVVHESKKIMKAIKLFVHG